MSRLVTRENAVQTLNSYVRRHCHQLDAACLERHLNRVVQAAFNEGYAEGIRIGKLQRRRVTDNEATEILGGDD